MRKSLIAVAMVAGLGLAACSQKTQDEASDTATAAGSDVAAEASDAGAAISNAATDAAGAVSDAGKEIKDKAARVKAVIDDDHPAATTKAD